jgi:hypothetical protein
VGYAAVNKSKNITFMQTPVSSPVPENTSSTSLNATATSTDGSTGITFEEDATIGPFPPQKLESKLLPDSNVNLVWYDPDYRLSHFIIYRKKANSDKWSEIATVPAKEGQEKYEYIDQTVVKGESYTYSVSVVDINGNESGHSESASIVLP